MTEEPKRSKRRGAGTDERSAGPADGLLALLAERQILDTLHRYCHSIDYGREDDWLDCFTEDGAFDVRRRVGDTPSRRHQGRAELARFIAGHTRSPDHWHKHLVMAPRISVHGDEATVSSYFTRLDANEDGEPVVHAFGRYRDRLVRCRDGRWRFTERVAEVEAARHRRT